MRKTLDDVIDDLLAVNGGFLDDAIYYLQEYKIKRERIIANAEAIKAEENRVQNEIAKYQEAIKNCELAENKYRRLADETSQYLGNTSQIDYQKQEIMLNPFLTIIIIVIKFLVVILMIMQPYTMIPFQWIIVQG